MAKQNVRKLCGERNLEIIQMTLDLVRTHLSTYCWGADMVHRSGWLVRNENGARVYVHETGWKVKDFCGPNEGIAVQTVGPDAGKELRNPGGRLFFSAFQAMLYVEKFLRGETPPPQDV